MRVNKPDSLPDPVPELKRRVARALTEQTYGIGNYSAARVLGIDQSDVSALFAGKLTRFSLDRLIRLMARAHGEVTVTVTWTNRYGYTRTETL